MKIKLEDIVQVIPGIIPCKTHTVTWENLNQNNLEGRRTAHKKKLGAVFDTLTIMNKVEAVIKEKPKDNHARQAIERVLNKERSDAKDYLPTGREYMRLLNAAYWVVSTCRHLTRNMFAWAYADDLPPMLANAKRRWFATPEMFLRYEKIAHILNEVSWLPEKSLTKSLEAFRENIRPFNMSDDNDTPDYEVVDTRITGHAVVCAGYTCMKLPIIFSLDCTFDLEGKVDGLPADWKVVMFRPATTTVTRKWK